MYLRCGQYNWWVVSESYFKTQTTGYELLGSMNIGHRGPILSVF